MDSSQQLGTLPLLPVKSLGSASESRTRSTFKCYAMMVASVVIAFVLTNLLPHLRERESFILFFAAVTISAWYGGRGPGLLACLISAALTNYYLYEPTHTFSFGVEAIVPLIVFMLVALMISSITSEMKAAEERTRQQHQWFQVILSSIDEAVISTDRDGRVSFMNPAAEKLTGASDADANGKFASSVLRFESPPNAPPVANPIDTVLSRNESIHTESGVLSHATNGRVMPADVSASPIKNVNGGIQGAVVVIRDISERQRARDRILRYQDRLRKVASRLALAEENERRQIATALHDRVSQTLALSRIKIHSIAASIDNPELRLAVGDLDQLLKRMMEDTRSLTFELSPPILYEFGLEPALEWLCEHFQKSHGVRCVFIDDGIEQPVSEDHRVVLFQSARELLTNVIKHSRAKQAVVRVTHAPSEVQVSVEDNGVGMDPAQWKSETHQGFGLFNLRERFEQLGGRCSINSIVNSGTRVALLLPSREPDTLGSTSS